MFGAFFDCMCASVLFWLDTYEKVKKPILTAPGRSHRQYRYGTISQTFSLGHIKVNLTRTIRSGIDFYYTELKV